MTSSLLGAPLRAALDKSLRLNRRNCFETWLVVLGKRGRLFDELAYSRKIPP
jgi:hypothetical protein